MPVGIQMFAPPAGDAKPAYDLDDEPSSTAGGSTMAIDPEVAMKMLAGRGAALPFPGGSPPAPPPPAPPPPAPPPPAPPPPAPPPSSGRRKRPRRPDRRREPGRMTKADIAPDRDTCSPGSTRRSCVSVAAERRRAPFRDVRRRRRRLGRLHHGHHARSRSRLDRAPVGRPEPARWDASAARGAPCAPSSRTAAPGLRSPASSSAGAGSAGARARRRARGRTARAAGAPASSDAPSSTRRRRRWRRHDGDSLTRAASQALIVHDRSGAASARRSGPFPRAGLAPIAVSSGWRVEALAKANECRRR